MLSCIYCVIRHESVLERIHEVEPGKALIGRGDECAIWLPDPHVSREHCVLSWTGERASIRDLGSRNGTHISGRQVRGEEPLNDAAEIRVGPYMLKVCFEIGDAIRCFVNSDITTFVDAARVAEVGAMIPTPPSLTPAQCRVYDALIDGLSEKEVAARLGISIHTVHTHAKAIYKTFAISSRAELVKRWAIQQANMNRKP